MFHSLDVLRLFRGCVVYKKKTLKKDPQKNDMGVEFLYNKKPLNTKLWNRILVDLNKKELGVPFLFH